MQIKNYGMGVRRVHSGFDLICEVECDGEWVEFWRTNEISNGFAYSESDSRCYAKTQEMAAAATPA